MNHLEIVSSDVGEISDPKDEADRVENVGFATAIKSGNGVELRIKTGYDGTLRIRLEAVDNNLLDIHDRDREMFKLS